MKKTGSESEFEGFSYRDQASREAGKFRPGEWENVGR